MRFIDSLPSSKNWSFTAALSRGQTSFLNFFHKENANIPEDLQVVSNASDVVSCHTDCEDETQVNDTKYDPKNESIMIIGKCLKLQVLQRSLRE